MAPDWLTIIAWISLGLAGVSALIIIADLIRHPQKMVIMDFVWPITALYFGVFGLWAYFAIGRKSERGHKREKPFWQTTFVGATHCGGGCTLGDIIAEWVLFWIGWTIAGIVLWPRYIADYILAYLLGILFQYYAIAPMRHLNVPDGLRAAIKADTLSLTAFEVGLFGWMALSFFVLFDEPHLHVDTPTFWFMMQLGMVVGFWTSYPVNWWLIRSGIKEKM